MKNRWFLLICFSFISVIVLAQTEVKIVGYIIDDSSEQKLPYVNIGIVDKHFGTVSDDNGFFELLIPDSLSGDTITISHIGYKKSKIPITQILSSSNQTIRLKTDEIVLEELVIRNRKLKSKKYGTKGHSSIVFMPAYIDKNIYEIAFLIKPKTTPVRVKALNMFIKHSFVDSCLFRINIYDNNAGVPGKKINRENILVRRIIKSKEWNKIDLLEYDLVFNDEIFVSVEFLPDFKTKETFQITYGVKMIRAGKTYIRKSSQGSWSIISFNASMNAEIEF